MTTATIRVVADAEIPGLESCLGDGWALQPLAATDITAERVRDADALLVRTLTRIDRALLEKSRVRFVGTATSGSDHVDRDYLAASGLAFADAAGSNANAVVDYCFAVLAMAARCGRLDPLEASYGIIGAGHVGGLLLSRLQAAGCRVLACDPPLQAQSNAGAMPFASLDEVLGCDVVSLHVPLLARGPNATVGLIDAAKLQQLKKSALLINTSRGEVIDESALLNRLGAGSDFFCALDVWQREPQVNASVVAAAQVATPHIAGYSRTAKMTATTMIVEQLGRYFAKSVSPIAGLTAADPGLGLEEKELFQSAWDALAAVFPLDSLSERFKADVAAGQRSSSFASMRRELRQRREFCEQQLSRSSVAKLSSRDRDLLRQLGLQLV
ncbi:MAG: 4-phosphoerythronate dehydrogenase [Gammaproteobacteria bacterium]